MDYKSSGDYVKEHEFEEIGSDDDNDLDPDEYNDSNKDTKAKFWYFFNSRKNTKMIPFIINELPLFWENIDVLYEGTLCFLEAMNFVSIKLIDSMFGIDNIVQRIKNIPNDASAAIAILIYPEYKNKIFTLEAIMDKSFNLDADMDGFNSTDEEYLTYQNVSDDTSVYCEEIHKDWYVFVKLLTQQYAEYVNEITLEELLMFADTEWQSAEYIQALINMYVKYTQYYPDLLNELHNLMGEVESGADE